MMKTQASILFSSVAVAVALLSGCSSSADSVAASTLPDGTYQGQSAVEDDGSYGVVSFSVSSGVVSDASFVIYDEDGTPHDENYGLGSDGTITNEEFYQRAQNAVAAEKEYVSEFEETGDQNEVETVAGASLSHRLFLDAVAQAINGGA